MCFLLSALISCVCLYKVYQKIHRITQYLHQAAKGETPSPLLEAEEGSFGYLANESTKVVHSLYRKATQSDEDKAALSRAISDISHQIKTPITSMTMLTDILLEQPVPEAQRVLFLQRIQAQLGRIKWLVDALLKLSKLDSGSVVMEKKTISCETLLEQCMLPLYPILQQRQITYLPIAGTHGRTRHARAHGCYLPSAIFNERPGRQSCRQRYHGRRNHKWNVRPHHKVTVHTKSARRRSLTAVYIPRNASFKND